VKSSRGLPSRRSYHSSTEKVQFWRQNPITTRLQLARFLGAGNSVARKADLAAHIRKALDGAGLRQAFERLDDIQRAAVAEAVLGSPRFDPEQLLARYGGRPPQPSLSQRWKPSAFDLFFIRDVMPKDLQARLKAYVPVPPRDAVKTSSPEAIELDDEEEEEVTVHLSEQAAVAELAAVLRLVDSGKVAVSDKTHRPSAAAMTAIERVLEGADVYPHSVPRGAYDDSSPGPVRAFAWPMLLQAGGLAQLKGNLLTLTRAGRAALSQPPGEVLRALWNKWLDTSLFDELSRIGCIKGQNGRHNGLTRPPSRRWPTAQGLSDCPVGEWVEIDELLRHMRAVGYRFEVSSNPWALYICDAQYGSLGYAEGSLLESQYVLAFLFEYAATLGIVDVAYAPPAGVRDDFRDLWGVDDMACFAATTACSRSG
jgi:hypothetical protein